MITRQSVEWADTKRWLLERRAEKLEELASSEVGIKRADHLRGMVMEIDEIIREVEPDYVVTTQPVVVRGAGY